ncbi:zinc finger and BTB domain-containing protein 16 [Melanotaenia boesemani]|uniref:zinc finger and BTB domain-containing protein 16 n=1 Tax=Melanotaenia boesemani TaxID=1250792 RepID=UPI001C04F7A9|nr:zinc finger and BTB domain-containing protein 16 [Melanotaenia boesemani]
MIRINNTQYFHFLQQADALRRSGSLCDAIILVKTQTFKAHRLVLACASRTLAQQLAQGDADSPVHCTLEYFSPHTFQQVLDFTYTQALEVPVKDLNLLLRAAQLLEMQQLEDQCREQLESLGAREEKKKVEITDIKEETEHVKEKHEKQKRSSDPEDKDQKTFCPVEKIGVNTVMENLSTINPPNIHNNPKSPRKKAKSSPISATLCNRESVITRPSTSTSSFSSPWTLPTNMWDSEMHLGTLRRIAENYSNLIAGHPLQSSNQSSVVYPFPITPQHMFPLLSPHFQTQLPNSAVGYSAFHPRYTQNLYTETSRMGSMFKHGLLKRKRPSQKVCIGTLQTGEPSNSGVSKASTERNEDCQHFSARLCDDPAPRESAPMQLVKSCAGCQFSGRKDIVQHQPESKEDHKGEKPYQCKHCPKKFSLKHQLDTHLRVHTGEKPFECRLCGQRSRDYSAMIKHLRTHGGATPYQCTVCLEFCSSQVAMQRHVKSHAVQDFPPDWSINSTYLYISHV